MANCAVFASGNGSNFQAVAEEVQKSEHNVVCLICDNPNAYVIERARTLGIPYHLVPYRNRTREEAEKEILTVLSDYEVDLIVLAGFMKLITSTLLEQYKDRIVNIHPSLLPKYPGAHAIDKSYDSKDKRLGITIHRIDTGMDTGPIILQKSFIRNGTETKEQIEEKIHTLEHIYYPIVVLNLLGAVSYRSESNRRR